MEQTDLNAQAKSIDQAFEAFRDQPLPQLPAWIVQELLTRSRRRYSPKDKVMRAVFPTGTALVDCFRSFPPYKHVLLQRGLRAAFKGWDTRILNQDSDDELPAPTLQRFRVGQGKADREWAFAEATFVFTSPDRRPIIAHVELGQTPFSGPSPQSLLIMSCATEDQDFATSRLDEIEAYLDRNNYFRGQKLDVSGRFLDQDSVYTWDDIFADTALVNAIRRQTQGFLERLESYRGLRLPTKRGCLIHGRPGCGKTMIGKVLSSQLKDTFIWAKPGDVGRDPEALEAVFDMARDLKPAMLFFEDLDLFTPPRRSGGFGNLILGEFMNQLDGLRSNDSLVVVATTNDLEAIEPAIKDRPSRFDCIFEIPDLVSDVRQRYLQGFLAKRNLHDGLFGEIDEITRECRTIAEVQERAIRWLQRGIESGLDLRKVTSLCDARDELSGLESLASCGPASRGIGFIVASNPEGETSRCTKR